MSNHKKVFTEIYKNNTWGGSGGGSIPEVTIDYRKLIEKFITENNIKKVVDFGCGDWMFSHLVNWGQSEYLGIDCVESVINENVKKFSSEKIKFKCSDTLDESGDLLLVKDVFQHWTNDQVEDFLFNQITKFKFILITNNSDQKEDYPIDVDTHIHTRSLSANFYPLKKFNAKILLQSNINEPKETCLVTAHI